MFKKIALSGLVLALLSFPTLAQQTATPAAPAQAHTRMGKNLSMSHRPTADATTRAKKMTDRMTQQLGLDQATSQKVYDVTLSRTQKVDAIQAGSDDNRAKEQALKANADDYKAKLKGILTPDQFTKLAAMKGRKRTSQSGPDDKGSDKDQH